LLLTSPFWAYKNCRFASDHFFCSYGILYSKMNGGFL